MLNRFINLEYKKIINRFLAIALVISLTFVNYIFLGMYIGKGLISYAKEENLVNLEVSQKFITNKVYKKDEDFKRIVQVAVSSKIQNAEGEAELIVPETVIEDKTAENVKIISYETEFTKKNNKVEFVAKDVNSFIITYVYDEECEYNEETKTYEVKQEPELMSNKISIVVEIEKNEELSANSETIEYTKGIQFGEIIEINETVSNLYKGDMYINEDTEYSTKLSISFKSLEEGIFEDSFAISSEEKVLAQKENEEVEQEKMEQEDELEEIKDSTYYKSTIFNKKELLDMFYNKDSNVIIESKSEDKTNKTIILFSEYDKEAYEDYIVIDLSKETETDEIVIEYEEGTNKVNILASMPIKEGILNITHNKFIKLEETTDVKSIQKLESNAILNDYNVKDNKEGDFKVTVEDEKEIKEPITKATVNMEYLNSNQTMLSSLIDNDIRLTVNLITNKNKYKLFENPIIEISLPDTVKIASISDASLTLEDGLIIKDTKASGNTIIIELEGKQESYNYDEVQQSISIGARVIVNKTTPSGDIEINSTCKNGEDETINLETIMATVFSPEELISLNTITVGENVTNSIEKNNLIKIDTFQKEKTAVIDTTLVNNHGSSINNLEIVGEISAENSTFNSALEKEIIASGLECEIKYFEGEDETTDIYKATSFVISIDEMKQGESLNIQYELSIPKNLPYNESLYTTLNSNYECEEKTESKTLTMQITTGKGPSAKIEILPEVKSDELNGGQIVTYNIKVTNDGDEDINEETILKYEILENAKIIEYTLVQTDAFEYLEDEDNIKQWKVSKILVGETKAIKVNIKLDNVKEASEIFSKATVTLGEEVIALKEFKEEINPADFEIVMTTNSNESLDVGDKNRYVIIMKNVSGRDLTNVVITTSVPEHTEFVEGHVYNKDTYEKISECNEKEGIISYNIDKVLKDETVMAQLVVRVQDLEKELNNEAEIKNYSIVKADGTNEHQSNISTIMVYTADFDIYLESTNQVTLKENDNIEYIIKVANKGKRESVANIIDILPEIVSANEIIYYTSEDNKKTTYINNSEFNFKYPIKGGETLTIIIKAPIDNLKQEDLKTINNVAKLNLGNEEFLESEVITNIIVKEKESQNNISNNEVNNGNNEQNEQNEELTYSISGVVWLDEDEDGTKKSTDKVMKDIEVILINATTGEFVKDKDGNIIKTTTSDNGEYTFTGLKNDNYKVIFKYDTTKYQTTTYKKNGVSNTINSDASSQTVTINEEVQTVALTDTITIKDSSVVNIDLGLKENNKFDLSLKKEIKKVTVKNNSGTSEYDFTNTNFAKIEIPGKYFKGSTLLIEYEITVTNEGDVAAYITDILDYMPKELSFNSEMNTNWYIDSAGNLHDIALSMETLEPGKSITEKLVLTTTLNSEEITTITNLAEIGSANNSEGLEEHDSIVANKKDGEDDIGKAEIIVSIKTGGSWLYIGITLISLIIISGGIYLINKKVLKGNI